MTTHPLPALRRRSREDGWTAAIQREFIEALSESGSVAKACETVHRSVSTAYRLRADPRATAFRAAWEAATAMAYRQVFELAMDRVVGGQEQPVFYRGDHVHQKTVYSDRLLCFMLDHLRPDRNAAPGVVVTRPRDDAGDVVLAGALAALDDANVGENSLALPEHLDDDWRLANDPLCTAPPLPAWSSPVWGQREAGVDAAAQLPAPAPVPIYPEPAAADDFARMTSAQKTGYFDAQDKALTAKAALLGPRRRAKSPAPA